MKECSGHSGDYLTIDCYKKLKHYFHENVKLYDDSAEILRNTLNTVTNKHHDMKSIPPIFKNLGTFFTGDNAFGYIGREPSCIYVNYWLNNELRKLYYNEHDYEFKVFKDFSDKFTVERGRKIDNSCSSYMEYYNEDKLNRIRILYELYEKFEEFISSEKHNTALQCDDIIFLRKYFNEFLNKHDGKDDKLMDKLMKFKELFITKVLENNSYCKNEKDNFQSSTQYLQKKKQEHEEAERAKLEAEAARVAQQRKKAEQEQARAKQDRERVEEAAKNLARTEEAAKDAQALQVSQTLQETEDELQRSLLLQPHYADTKLSENFRFEETRKNRIDPQLYETEDTRSTFQSGEGIIYSIKDTFTTIVQNVDPAPVLGVSGGMGVLFILFKYTPVGSFFGGRRGRFRQIPSSFRGFPPDFANFQEYGGGYVGYSPMDINPLAE